MPVDIMSVYVQFAAGKDEFLGDESIPAGREQFGLLDASFKNWNIGTTISAGEKVQFGANFGREDFSALQKSRNANPPPDATWTDPNRNWTLDNDEEVRNFNVFVDLFKAIEKTDIRLADQRLQRFGQLVPARRAAHHVAHRGGHVPGVAQRYQHLEASVGRRELLLHQGRGRGRGLLL